MTLTPLEEAMAHLGAALMQTIPSDDQIIMDHVRSAHQILQAEIRAQCSRVSTLERLLRPFAMVADRDISSEESDHDYFRPMSIQNNRAPLLTVGDFRRASKVLSAPGDRLTGAE